MEGREKSYMDKYKKTMNDFNYEASCTLTSLLVFVLKIVSSSFLFCRMSISQSHGSLSMCVKLFLPGRNYVYFIDQQRQYLQFFG